MRLLSALVLALSGAALAAPATKRSPMDYYDDDDFSMKPRHDAEEQTRGGTIYRKDESDANGDVEPMTRGGTIYRRAERDTDGDVEPMTRGGTIYRKDESEVEGDVEPMTRGGTI